MSNTEEHNMPVGVIGSGSFGTAIANLLAENRDVLLYTRREEVLQSINEAHTHMGKKLSERIRATTSMEEVGKNCTLIFPIVSSEHFREMMRDLSPHLKPYHLLIHGTKGLDNTEIDGSIVRDVRTSIHTMSEVIIQESAVRRVGCLSGPNLSAEIFDGQPTATVVASRFTEVIKAGQDALRSNRFQVYGSHDITGAELAGALKNIIAIGSGMLAGLGMGKNVWALLVNRGLIEMIHLGRAMGADTHAFLGVAGMADLIATASSEKSRNYTFGFRMAKGETLEQILGDMNEVAEGVRTLKIAQKATDYYKIHTPIVSTLNRVIFTGFPMKKAIEYLMTYPYAVDVDFL